jgi:hypothetical protein
MRYLLFSAAVIVGAEWMGSMPATATPASGHSPNVGVKLVEEVGYWRRQYRRYYRYGYGYAAPYAYYPPAYAYYPPAPCTVTMRRTVITRPTTGLTTHPISRLRHYRPGASSAVFPCTDGQCKPELAKIFRAGACTAFNCRGRPSI